MKNKKVLHHSEVVLHVFFRTYLPSSFRLSLNLSCQGPSMPAPGHISFFRLAPASVWRLWGRCRSFLAKQDPSPQQGEDDGIGIVVVPAPDDSTEPAIPRICVASILCSREGSGRRLSRLSKNERRDRISFNRPPMVGRGVSMQ